MKIILFALEGNEKLTQKLASHLDAEIGESNFRKFPDGESYTQILSDVKGKCVVIVATLHEPDSKLLPLYFLSNTAKSLGAMCTCLVAPYLAYMRQDKVFHEGEGITAKYFGKLISGFADSVTTIDPHLHRISSLGEVYHIPNTVIHAADDVAKWIKENIPNPVLIGPDSESEQWVSKVAKTAEAPFTVLQKIRHGDRDVEVSVPNIEKYKDATPVLVDDIISTARTMIETVQHLKNAGMKSPICIGIHAVFSGNAYEDLLESGVERIVSCNTIPHTTNEIDLSKTIASEVKKLMHHI